MRKMLLIMISAIAAFALAACTGNKVDESASKKFIPKAEEIVSLLNEAKYKEVHEKFDSKMKAALPEEKMKDLTPVIEKAGTFEKIEKQSIEEKDGLYTVILVAKYSKEQRTFIITYNDKEEIAGLVIK
ncbi:MULTISPECIES: DUF3887 domain-containing protein [unclassified Bacillus (in: firmicutes)]|uniref:DUF3887 domain-containing protein n=1 Tax=unclassified Bacillus (in: firmicutes) TaxID=185979 RepID=UPI00033086AF|nr:DUF3887 domain-containing protein [Bacillus wiedmannii]EOP11413.1 hypothetical protein ICS_02654 [Bacillus cereus BAG2O-3]EOQ11156.1 hypothetical protein KQ3_02235 [Bacillus cereus B5-2]PEW36671.1 DUF3887 domain-containing protein [Bacillus cereus]PFW54073.1 DUF3887 domain-containing protein [Bacillus sp. AFS075960]RFB43381.1 DUF3887 domain-containing protein [Bacillus sp. dmp10]RFB71815.1 DUF3887 domain-containing protein [Bacillus sp. AW]